MIEVKLVEGQRVTSGYGLRKHPITQRLSFHNGIDVVGNNTRLLAIHDGEIVKIGFDKISGHYIKVRYLINGSEYVLSYCHLEKALADSAKGKIVQTGEWIGIMGSSGRSTATHLHLTVSKDKEIVDPLKVFNLI